ncbi:MAG: hypothetical protein HC933_04970 [Pleurocapsa sp. SU_196_0]|nr:hypothetical protein [Pleurocapsa sp. SU_196_0]
MTYDGNGNLITSNSSTAKNGTVIQGTQSKFEYDGFGNNIKRFDTITAQNEDGGIGTSPTPLEAYRAVYTNNNALSSETDLLLSGESRTRTYTLSSSGLRLASTETTLGSGPTQPPVSQGTKRYDAEDRAADFDLLKNDLSGPASARNTQRMPTLVSDVLRLRYDPFGDLCPEREGTHHRIRTAPTGSSQ